MSGFQGLGDGCTMTFLLAIGLGGLYIYILRPDDEILRLVLLQKVPPVIAHLLFEVVVVLERSREIAAPGDLKWDSKRRPFLKVIVPAHDIMIDRNQVYGQTVIVVAGSCW